MEIVIGIIIGLAIGFFVGKLMEAKSAGEEKTQLVAKAQVLTSEIEQEKKQMEQYQLQVEKEKESLRLQFENEKQNLKDNQELFLMNERGHHAEEISSLKEQMISERQYAAKLRAESDQQWAQKLENLKQ